MSLRQTFRLAYHFGLFQALMPIIGWLAGRSVERWIGPIDHWIAFGLLTAIGGKMIYEALKGDDEDVEKKDPTKGLSLVVLSVATSIDALAVGLSLALLGVKIWYPALVIGFVAFGVHGGRPAPRQALRRPARTAHGDRRRGDPHRHRGADPRRAPHGLTRQAAQASAEAGTRDQGAS